MVLLGLALYGLYSKHLSGAWRWIYVTTAVASLYLNVLVLIVQSFQKIPALTPLAPTQSEPPFLIAQVIALFVFRSARHARSHEISSRCDCRQLTEI